jgi:Tol biopolymer transport system component
MTPKPDLLDELAPLFPPPEMPYEGVLRRRGRKQRNQRTAAAVLGLAIFVAGIVAFANSMLSGSSPGPAHSSSPGVAIHGFTKVRGWITYRSGSNIVAVDPANSSDTLVLGPSPGLDPIGWSADGTRLLLGSGYHEVWAGEATLWVFDSDGSWTGVSTPQRATWGSFSPDGSEIAYGCCGSSPGPYIIDVGSATPRSLGGSPCDGSRDASVCGEPFFEWAAWSPDGSRIAWADFVEESSVYGEHAYVLSLVNPDGSGLQREVARLSSGDAWGLVWSPDGSQLAFWDTDDLNQRPGRIFVINADGSGLRMITQDGDNRWPTWSPDGSRIAFVHDGELFTMDADGSDMQKVEGVHPSGAIAWNPAG